ncbi:MAG: DNA repair protein RadC [Alistipes sp.]|nr:DNA repair protein RadC [Alistipes sp.]
MRELYEKLSLYGVSALSDSELMGVIIDDQHLAARLMERYTTATLPVDDISRLRMAEGMGLSRAAKVAAAVEFAKRRAVSQTDNVSQILSCSDAVRVLKPLFEDLKHEECWVLFLTSSARVVERMKISQGGVQSTVVDNKLIIKRALELLATQILIAHNHPSGTACPSPADIALTQRVKAAAELFDITLMDHIIIAKTGYYSFKSQHKL